MSQHNTNVIRALGVALAGALTVLLVACATTSTPPSSSAPVGSGDAGAAGAAAPLEEITVTGSRVEGDSADIHDLRSYRGSPMAAQSVQAPPRDAAPAGTVFADRLSRNALLSQTQPGEELWVIQAADRSDASNDDDSPGSGTMLAFFAQKASPQQKPREIPLPLRRTDVHAAITGYIGSVDVTQQFENPYDEKIEAVYLFPLPEKAAINEFVMTIGQRKIRGILREKEEARQIYEDARAQGYSASLLVQHRPNVFEQKVANIEPGKRIDVSIRYFHALAYEDGWYSFVFPTVVGPRYNPVGASDPVAAVRRTNYQPPATGTAVRYLRPSERSAHDLTLSVDIDAGVAIEDLDSSHAITTRREGASRAHVELATATTIPNRDFILRFRVAGERIKSSLLTYVDPATRQGYFTAYVYPPATPSGLHRQPVEMVFVVDTSGSMSGQPLAQAKAAILAALDRLERSDTFQVMNFSTSVGQFADHPVVASLGNVERAREYVRRLGSAGGTEMLGGIRAALGFAADEERTRYVTFLTDGFIGNEAEILAEVHRRIGSTRIFSFGVGNSVNRYLLDGLATEGRGAVAYLALDDSADKVMEYYFDRISRPALTDTAIDWNGFAVSDVYPARLPDLFSGRPIVVTGKFRGEPHGISLRGRIAGQRVTIPIGTANEVEQPGLRALWARLRIEDLSRQQTWNPAARGSLAGDIRTTALEYGLMSAYTSFVAVDASERTAGERGTTVYQAVPVPDGVRYETTVTADR